MCSARRVGNSIWEVAQVETMIALLTVFSSYGAFWMSLGTIYIPASGIMTAYADPSELAGAIGIYLITWAMVTFFFL
jgi:succinate-acetate transporter protein